MMGRVQLAAYINRLHGGAVVSAWDIDDLPEVDLRCLIEEAWAIERVRREGVGRG